MNDKKTTAFQAMRYFFYFLMLAIFGWFLFMQVFGTNERTLDIDSDPESVIYQGTITWEKSDGTTEEITVPGDYDVAPGETMVLTTRLPIDYENSAIAIRSSLQDVAIYVDGQLRIKYDTDKTRLVGKNSASRYVFCPTSGEDAGKELRIELTTYTSNYAGVVNTIYSGDKVDIWLTIFSQYGLVTYIAFFSLFAGLTSILFSFTLGLVYHTSFDMEYLGWCMIMGAVWMLGESKLRQLLVPNASSLGSLCFVMILLCPIPILLYADSVQKGRHRRMYHFLAGLSVLNFAVSSILMAARIADYIETLPIGQLLLVITLFTVFVHLVRYTCETKNNGDRVLIIGLISAIVCIVIESVSVYFVTTLSGIFIGIGMLILLFVNIIRTVHNIQSMEQKRRQQELRKKQEQTEKMSLQMMQTLSTTIEAKDDYTRGHSYRVAEYAALIAAELGWSPKEIQDLKHAAHLHDIGKIGIPDQILNKPSRLTEEEYNLIRKHTVIGAEILKDVTLIPHVIEVARSHHERYDGTGYPDRLAGTEIPIHARIIAMADSYDAMNSRRIYRNALPPELIRNEIQKNKGIQFDPDITDVFLKLMDENRLVIQDPFSEDPASLITPEIDHSIEKFISEVVTTIKTQEDSKNYDFLTGLPMRSLGEQQIAKSMQEKGGCLIFLDMDNLKKINDIHGHTAGDRALKTLGRLLLKHIAGGTVCRLGGDEFLLFLPDADRTSASETIEKLFQEFHNITSEDVQIQYASLSAGLCMCTRQSSFDDCYSKADKALYYVKQNGKNQFAFFQQFSNENMSATAVGKDLTQIAKALRESGTYVGALDLNYRDFARQYEYMHQLIVRSKCHCCLVMVTMETAADTLPHIETIEQALEHLEQAIRQKIRRVDICTRYSAMQYLIILFEPIETQIPNIMERIFLQYYRQSNSQDFQPTYDYIVMEDDK